VIYLWPQNNSQVNKLLHSGFGVLTGPSHETVSIEIRSGRLWACDNGAYDDKFSERQFFHFLAGCPPR
jgi:hypothetical protein